VPLKEGIVRSDREGKGIVEGKRRANILGKKNSQPGVEKGRKRRVPEGRRVFEFQGGKPGGVAPNCEKRFLPEKKPKRGKKITMWANARREEKRGATIGGKGGGPPTAFRGGLPALKPNCGRRGEIGNLSGGGRNRREKPEPAPKTGVQSENCWGQ